MRFRGDGLRDEGFCAAGRAVEEHAFAGLGAAEFEVDVGVLCVLVGEMDGDGVNVL